MITDKLKLPLESEVKKIIDADNTNLPSFPQVAKKLMETANDDSITLEDVVKIIETDPGIAVSVFKLVNSAYYGLSRKITTLSDAVVILGLNKIKKLALDMTLFKNLFKQGQSKEFDRLLFWRHSLAVAVLSMKLARNLGGVDPEEAYLAGLLHDVGKIFFDLYGKTDYGAFIKELSDTTELVIERERRILGMGHDDIGAFFCAQWQLPERILLAAKYHHKPFDHEALTPGEKRLITVVSMADFLCTTQGMGSFECICPPVLVPDVENYMNPEKADIIRCIHETNEEMEKLSAFYKFPFPTVSQRNQNQVWANLKLSRVNTTHHFRQAPDLPDPENKRFGDEPLSPELMFEMAKAMAKAKTLKEVMDILMFQVGCILQPCHWSILLNDSKTEELVFSMVMGTNNTKLKGVRLPKGEGIAGFIQSSGKPLIIEDVEHDDRFSNRMDMYTSFKTRSIIGVPLKTDDKIFGVIELINRIDDKPFSENDLTLLSNIAEHAAIAIERSYYTQALNRLATKDPLTGLKNKSSFERAVSGAKKLQAQFGNTFSMLLIQIKDPAQSQKNQVSQVKQADVMLFANILKKITRSDDSVYRYSDRTFIVMMRLTDSQGAKQLTQQIELAVKKTFESKKRPPLSLIIQSYALDSKDAGQFTSLVSEALAQPGPKSSSKAEPPSKAEPLAKPEPVSKAEEEIEDVQTEDIQDDMPPVQQDEQDKDSEEELDNISEIRKFGKKVSLGGNFKDSKTEKPVGIQIEQISLHTIGFRIPKSHHVEVNDLLDIEFRLDNSKDNSLIKRKFLVTEIDGGVVYADFCVLSARVREYFSMESSNAETA